jgi:hypothetical protein
MVLKLIAIKRGNWVGGIDTSVLSSILWIPEIKEFLTSLITDVVVPLFPAPKAWTREKIRLAISMHLAKAEIRVRVDLIRAQTLHLGSRIVPSVFISGFYDMPGHIRLLRSCRKFNYYCQEPGQATRD